MISHDHDLSYLSWSFSFSDFSALHHFRVPYEANNGIRVANRSAHGVGIYTASMESPQLSLGFIRPSSRARQLLVCGVLDDAVQSGELKSFGALTVKAESEAVRRGDAGWKSLGKKDKDRDGMGWGMGYLNILTPEVLQDVPVNRRWLLLL